jgi:hypothetical protein
LPTQRQMYSFVTDSEWYVPTFLRRTALPFAREHVQTPADEWSGFSWKDDLVHIAKSISFIWIGILLSILIYKADMSFFHCFSKQEKDGVNHSISINYRNVRIEEEFLSHKLLILKATSQQCANRILL